MLVVQTGQRLHLSSLIKRAPADLTTGDHIRGAVIIDESATLGEGCMIGPDVSIGPACKIGNGVRLSNCVIMKGCTVCLRHMQQCHATAVRAFT
jgi:mannose-1-phosphate guanylyltransferase